MPTKTQPRVRKVILYPGSDGRPMAETDWHRELMLTLIKVLEAWFALQPMVYVSGNLLVYYERGNRHRHLSPDVFVVLGAPKRQRKNYLIWEEGRTLDFALEITSASTKEEDLDDKFGLYQDTLRVREYFLFDPLAEYLEPPLRGYRLRDNKYVPIRPLKGRLPSKVLGLHLERAGQDLRLWNPATSAWLPTPEERIHRAEVENERLRRELEQLRRRLANGR